MFYISMSISILFHLFGFEVKHAPRMDKDYALFFAVSEYENANLQQLPNSVKDAEQIAEVLRTDFGFNTEIIKNPSLKEIEDKLYEYKKKFAKNQFEKKGQLLIFSLDME